MSDSTQNELITQEFSSSVFIGDIEIRRDKDGRYCLNDFHRAAGENPSQAPGQWLRTQQSQDLIIELDKSLIFSDMQNPISVSKAVKIVKGFTAKQGTYGIKKVVYAYAMWISPVFTIKVIDVFEQFNSRIFTPSWSEVRENGVLTRHASTDKIKEFVLYAAAQGSYHSDTYYKHFTELAYRSLFVIPKGLELKNLRNRLDTRQLTNLSAVENLIGSILDEGMSRDIPYHDIYAMVKDKCHAYGELVGKTPISLGYISRQEAQRLDQIKEPSTLYA